MSIGNSQTYLDWLAQQDDDDMSQQQAEMGKEREQEAEAALLYLLHLMETRPKDDRQWEHLVVLCRECGISYQSILNRGLGH